VNVVLFFSALLEAGAAAGDCGAARRIGLRPIKYAPEATDRTEWRQSAPSTTRSSLAKERGHSMCSARHAPEMLSTDVSAPHAARPIALERRQRTVRRHSTICLVCCLRSCEYPRPGQSQTRWGPNPEPGTTTVRHRTGSHTRCGPVPDPGSPRTNRHLTAPRRGPRPSP
jgi:hypothetical protein